MRTLGVVALVHEIREEGIGHRQEGWVEVWISPITDFGESSNGRTGVFGAPYRGSNPCSPVGVTAWPLLSLPVAFDELALVAPLGA